MRGQTYRSWHLIMLCVDGLVVTKRHAPSRFMRLTASCVVPALLSQHFTKSRSSLCILSIVTFANNVRLSW